VQVTPAQPQLSTGSGTDMQELFDVEVESRAAKYNCKTTGVFPVLGECSSYYLCHTSLSGKLRADKRTCYPNNYNPFRKICSSSFECPGTYTCNNQGFLCFSTTSYVKCEEEYLQLDIQMCELGSYCNNKCSLPCTYHILLC
jgi:hypothetical protein